MHSLAGLYTPSPRLRLYTMRHIKKSVRRQMISAMTMAAPACMQRMPLRGCFHAVQPIANLAGGGRLYHHTQWSLLQLSFAC